MQISPGTQLVWSLSGSEAVNLSMPLIEPDHLYCGLLKFSELSDDTVGRLLTNSSDAPAVCAERDNLKGKFTDLQRSTAETRHAIRKEAERGSHKLEGNLIHRSDASKKIFEKAIELANNQNEPTGPTHLLQALMENPTPAMKKVLKIDDGLPQWLEELDEENPEPAARRFSWLQPVEELAPKKGFSISKASQPQLIVLAKALGAADPFPLLLIGEEGVDASALLWKARVDGSSFTILKADINKLLADLAEMDDPAETGSAAADMLSKALEEESVWIFIDMTGIILNDESLRHDLILVAQKHGRLILVVSEKTYLKQIKADPAFEAGFRSIWLHNLAVDHPVDRV